MSGVDTCEVRPTSCASTARWRTVGRCWITQAPQGPSPWRSAAEKSQIHSFAPRLGRDSGALPVQPKRTRAEIAAAARDMKGIEAAARRAVAKALDERRTLGLPIVGEREPLPASAQTGERPARRKAV